MSIPSSPSTGNRQTTASIFGRPMHAMLVPFPITCFVGALLTDIAYVNSANVQWSNFSNWLITAGLVMGSFAALTGLIDYAGDRRIRATRSATLHMLLNIAVWVLEIFNAFVHNRDGWRAVVPTGITLSAISVAMLVVSAWLGHTMVYRDGVGVAK